MNHTFYFDPNRLPVDWESAATVVLANPEWLRREDVDAGKIERALPALEAHVWVATSGTSRGAETGGQAGQPAGARWIALSKQAFLASARAVNEHLAASSSDAWAHALPVFHVGGLGILARAHLSGSTLVAAVVDRWDARRFRDVVASSRATLSALVPSQIHDLVHARLSAPPSLRAIVVGGARLDPALYRSARELGWACLPSYGLTETCSQVATASLESLASDSCPMVLPVLGHARMRADEDRRIAVHASSLLTCAAEVVAGRANAWDPKRDGWLVTEDVGNVTADGVQVLGRVSESVKILGEMVSVNEVEERVMAWARQEGLSTRTSFDLAVVAVPHERRGHDLVLALSGGGVAGELRKRVESSLVAFCRDTLMPYERIERVAWVERIPRTALGKVQRAQLARELEQ